VRQEGLLDAKEMVRKSADVLVGAAEAARLQEEAEAAAAAAEAEAEAEAAAAAAAEAEAEAEVPVAAAIPVAAPIAAPPGAFAGVLDALKRSPLMLDLPADHPGLATIAGMVSAGMWGAGALLRSLAAAPALWCSATRPATQPDSQSLASICLGSGKSATFSTPPYPSPPQTPSPTTW
jgi:hypothetical protein